MKMSPRRIVVLTYTTRSRSSITEVFSWTKKGSSLYNQVLRRRLDPLFCFNSIIDPTNLKKLGVGDIVLFDHTFDNHSRSDLGSNSHVCDR